VNSTGENTPDAPNVPDAASTDAPAAPPADASSPTETAAPLAVPVPVPPTAPVEAGSASDAPAPATAAKPTDANASGNEPSGASPPIDAAPAIAPDTPAADTPAADTTTAATPAASAPAVDASAPAADASAPAAAVSTSGVPSSITVKAGHVQPLWAGHPWVFRQAVVRQDEGLKGGDEVVVVDPHGKVLGRGLYSKSSAIAVRLFTSQGSVPIDEALIRSRIELAVALRRSLDLPNETPGAETTGYRLVHGEGDGLPGLVVDRFGDDLVVQLGTAGLRRLQSSIVNALTAVVGGDGVIIDRTSPNVAKQEGFTLPKGAVRMLRGDAPSHLTFSERGLRYSIPIELGQKTGFYFDQRPLRDRIEALSRGSRVLDACSYVGPIALAAARGGAKEVWAVDTSVPAVEAGKAIAEANELLVRFEATDMHKAFKQATADGGWDVVVCDPPKFAKRRRHKKQASGGYRKLAAEACAATAPGGLLVLCSCSGAVDMDTLQRQLALGARDAGRRALIIDRCVQGADHPVPAAFSEGLYLSVLIARVLAP
jgi:23S rRNA (cytosine1962-C5)-methyltransferase